MRAAPRIKFCSPFLLAHASMQGHQVGNKDPELVRQEFQVILALGEENGGTALGHRFADIVQDEVVAVGIGGHGGV